MTPNLLGPLHTNRAPARSHRVSANAGAVLDA